MGRNDKRRKASNSRTNGIENLGAESDRNERWWQWWDDELNDLNIKSTACTSILDPIEIGTCWSHMKYAHFSHAHAHAHSQHNSHIRDIRMDRVFPLLISNHCHSFSHSIRRFAWHFFACVCVLYPCVFCRIHFANSVIVSRQLNSSDRKESNTHAWGDHYNYLSSSSSWYGYSLYFFVQILLQFLGVPGISISVYFSTASCGRFLSCCCCCVSSRSILCSKQISERFHLFGII